MIDPELRDAGLIRAIFFRTSDVDLELLERGLAAEALGESPPEGYAEAWDRLMNAGRDETADLLNKQRGAASG